MGTTGRFSAMGIRAVVQHESTTLRLTLSESSTVADLAACCTGTTNFPVDQMRLIANGRELDSGESLSSLGEFFFYQNMIHLKKIDQEACRDWEKTGRCKHGQRCPRASTHDMHHSPRYVAYQQPSSSTVSPSTTTTTSSLPKTSPRESLEPSAHASSPVSHPTNEGAVICRNWCNEGSCRFGDRCHFASSHVAANLPKNETHELH